MKKFALLFCLSIYAQFSSAGASNYFKIAEPWSQETQQKYYGEGIKYNAQVFLAINSVLYETPVSLFGMAVEEATNPATGAEISTIVDVCRNFAASWDRIACAAQKVEALMVKKDYGIFSAPCRALSSTFIKVFRRLEIPRAWVGYKAANFTMPWGKNRIPLPTFHVANVIVLTGADGQIYSYVLDLAFFEHNLYPISQNAIEFHTQNNPSGSVLQDLPELL